MSRRAARPAQDVSAGRTARERRAPDGPNQTGLWGDEVPVPSGREPVAAHPTNDPEQWARVLSAAASEGGLMVTAGRRGVRRVLARVPGSGAGGGPEQVTTVPAGDAAVVFQALAAGHVELGTGRHQVRCGRHEGPAVRVLVPARTHSLLARWRSYVPTTGRTDV